MEQHKFIHRKKIETKTLPCQISSCTYIKQSSTIACSHSLDDNDVKVYECGEESCGFQCDSMEQLKM